MPPGRSDAIARAIEELTGCIWAYEHRDHLRSLDATGGGVALHALSVGAGISAEAALAALGPLDWTEDDLAPARRAIEDLRVWAEQGDDVLHPAAGRALTPVLADLTRTGGPALRVEHRTWELGLDLELWVGGTGVAVDQFGDDEENVGLAASDVQRIVMETIWNAWPPCPRHPDNHALEVGDTHWTCPDGTPIAVIGRLGLPGT
ncbi:MAG: hypothetical protein ACT4QF_05520 [Sporichthyaceae bacterium]